MNTFIDSILPAAPDIPIQIAHLGGDSQYDAAARRAAESFRTAFQDHPRRTANVLFDLALVPLPEELARGDSAVAAQIRSMNEAFAAMAAELGPDRIVFGSDYPEVSVADYLAGIRTALPMDSAAITDLLDDPAPYLR